MDRFPSMKKTQISLFPLKKWKKISISFEENKKQEEIAQIRARYESKEKLNFEYCSWNTKNYRFEAVFIISLFHFIWVFVLDLFETSLCFFRQQSGYSISFVSVLECNILGDVRGQGQNISSVDFGLRPNIKKDA